MGKPLRVLIVEDSEDDVRLLIRELRRGGYDVEFERVETSGAMQSALMQKKWDLILSDYSLPEFNAPKALELLKASGLDLPFIIVSGTIGEESAVTALKAGANDFLVKGNLARLGPAIDRELREAESRRERRRAENQLNYHARLLKYINDAVIATDDQFRITAWNRAAERMYGWSSEEVLGRYISEILSGEITDMQRVEAGELLTQSITPRDERIYRRKDGRTIYVEANTIALTDANGKMTGFVSVDRDITEHKQAEQALRESEERFRRAIQDAPYPAMIHAEDGEIISVNTIWLSLTGYAREEIPTIDAWTERAYGERKEIVQAAIDKLYMLESAYDEGEDVVRTANGEIRTWHFSSAPLGRLPDGRRIVISLANDVTEREQVEKALHESEIKYRNLVETSHDLIWAVDGEGIFTYLNQAAQEIYGFEPEELIGRPFFDIMDEQSTPRSLEEFKKTIAGVDKFVDAEAVVRHKDGRQIILSANSIVLRDNGDNLIGIIGTSRDITERKRAEEALRKSERVLREAESLGRTGSWEQDLVTGEIFNTEENLRLFFGDDRGKGAVLADYIEVVHPEDRDYVIRRRSQLLEGGQPDIEYRVVWPDGSVYMIYGLATVVRDDSGKAIRVYGTNVDVTERRQAENKVKQQLQRLTALREIDRAIASTSNVQLSLGILLSQTLSLLGIDAGDIMLVNPALNLLEYAAGKGFRTKTIENAQVRLGEGLAGRAALTSETIEIPDLNRAQLDPYFKSLVQEEGFVEYVGVPLVSKGKVLGVLEAYQRNAVSRDPDWLDFLESLAGQASIAIDNAQSFEGMQRLNMELIMAYDATIEGWSRAMDLRDRETEGHTQRVTELTLRLAERMGLSMGERAQMRRGALLHDIGKLGVPDSILLKPGKLTDDEWEIMKGHPALARDMLSSIVYLRSAIDIPYCHHEKWDGTGYPRELKKEQIPLAARIFAVADVWDALTSDRPYRSAWTKDAALDYIREQSGKHFDPQIAEVFLQLIHEE